MTFKSISSIVLAEEAKKLWLKVIVISENKNLFYIKSDNKEVLFKSTDFWLSSSLWIKLSGDKELSYEILKRNWIPMTNTLHLGIDELSSLDSTDLIFPVIIKPVSEAHWNWVMMNILNMEELKEKLILSFKKYERMIVQKQIEGSEYRLLVLMWKVILSINRIPASVLWDWEKNILDLINQENDNNILRWSWYSKALTNIIIDDELISYIWKQWMNLKSIPTFWNMVKLRWTSNIWTWGTMIEVSDIVSDDIKRIACKSAKVLWLWIAWVDIITTDISKPLNDTWWIVLEVNDTPWLWWDRELTNVNTWKVILEEIFF